MKYSVKEYCIIISNCENTKDISLVEEFYKKEQIKYSIFERNIIEKSIKDQKLKNS